MPYRDTDLVWVRTFRTPIEPPTDSSKSTAKDFLYKIAVLICIVDFFFLRPLYTLLSEMA